MQLVEAHLSERSKGLAVCCVSLTVYSTDVSNAEEQKRAALAHVLRFTACILYLSLVSFPDMYMTKSFPISTLLKRILAFK